QAFKPMGRNVHTATLIGNKLYILGGVNSREFFYLDVSVPFNTQNLLWNDLTSTDIIPPHYGAASVRGGANNNTLFLYGGIKYSGGADALVYTFDSQSNIWNTAKIAGDNAVNTFKRSNLRGVADNS